MLVPNKNSMRGEKELVSYGLEGHVNPFILQKQSRTVVSQILFHIFGINGFSVIEVHDFSFFSKSLLSTVKAVVPGFSTIL